MIKFNNLKVERCKSNLKYTESKLVKKDHIKRKKNCKSHYHIGITQKKTSREKAEQLLEPVRHLGKDVPNSKVNQFSL